MARPLRLEHAGALWHVTSRGNERKSIFGDDSDRLTFLGILAEVIRRFSWRLHAYVLMSNHYHLLLETLDPSLSRGMHRLNAVYSQYFNRKHDRAGHLLQGRFKGILVEKERHLLELVRYVVLNPVRAGLVQDAADWPWSNYRSTAGLVAAPPWLETRWTVEQFGGGSGAFDAYRDFVHAGVAELDNPWSRVTGQLFLGGEQFRERMRDRIERAGPTPEVPRQQRIPQPRTVCDIVKAAECVLKVPASEIRRPRRSPFRLVVTYIAREDTLVTLAEIGAVLAISASSVCEIHRAARRLRKESPEFRGLIRQVRSSIRRMKT